MKRNLLFVAVGIMLFFMSACDNIHNPLLPEKKEKGIIPVEEAFTIKIDISGNVSGDKVTASPGSGDKGDTITLSYTVENTKFHNLLEFGGVTASIASVNSAGSGTRIYTVNTADSSNGVITIIAVFTHTDLELDPIAFEDTATHITKTYGDAAFTNAITTEHSGSGAITYSSSDTTVATVNSSGQVTIHKVGSAIIITAKKAADAVYAHAQANYMLTVNPKPVTITVNVNNKTYDGTTTATGTVIINGKIDGDDVTASGTAVFADAMVGNDKTVTFSGYSLTGADAGNYSLSAQPASVTANITSMIEMVPIPAGTFIMGSPESEPNRESSKETQHSVTLTKSFYMGKYQVTQKQYQMVMGADEDRTTTYYGKGDDYPIHTVSWCDALVFCNRLSIMEGLSPVYSIGGSTDPVVWIANNGGSIPTNHNAAWNAAVMDMNKNGYRLPTEAEWEYACRGDYPNKATETNTKPFGIGDGTKMVSGMANFWDNRPYDLAQSGQYNDTDGTYVGKATAVGSYTANNYGLYDMHGNVWEWCWDRYKADITADNTNPTGAAAIGYDRVCRGGDWDTDGKYLRSAYRDKEFQYFRSISFGIRLVRP